MKRLLSIVSAMAVLASGLARAQAFPPNEAGVTMGHVHLNTRDVEASKKLFVTLGGTAIKAGAFDVVRFPGVAVYLHLAAGAAPSTGGSVGSTVNHFAFVVPNVQEAVARWTAAGVTLQPGLNGRTDQAFILTSDELRLEILEDKNQQRPIQHHHVHFNVSKEVVEEMQAWYAKWFGATPGMRGQNKAGDIPGANLTYGVAAMPKVVPTKGRVLDHIGFDVKNLEAFCKKLEAAGIKLDRPYTKNPQTGAGMAFFTDPWGTYIELNERPNPL